MVILNLIFNTDPGWGRAAGHFHSGRQGHVDRSQGLRGECSHSSTLLCSLLRTRIRVSASLRCKSRQTRRALRQGGAHSGGRFGVLVYVPLADAHAAEPFRGGSRFLAGRRPFGAERRARAPAGGESVARARRPALRLPRAPPLRHRCACAPQPQSAVSTCCCSARELGASHVCRRRTRLWRPSWRSSRANIAAGLMASEKRGKWASNCTLTTI